jgi:hypothetical protein
MTDDLYRKVGVVINDAIFLANPANPNGVTGQAANFTMTLAKDSTGNQATTGITIAEVSSANNPGLYSLVSNATTSFVANTGAYHLVVRWTTDPNYQFPKTYWVTSDGTGAGTFGAASFTATAANGRITDGAAPLSGATIYFTTPSPALTPYASLTSDSSGLWGPIWFPADGVWPFTVMLAGYSVGSGTVTVSGATATGPGADIELDAATATGLTLTNLKTYARFQVRGNVGTATDTMILSAINDALFTAAKEFKHSWLQTDGQLIFNTYYSTGSITLTNGSPVVTLASGTFPSWAGDGNIYYAGQAFPILTRDSGTQVTLTTNWAGDSIAGQSYVLYQDAYDLPSDCLVFNKALPGTGWGWGPDPISFPSFRVYQSTFNVQSPQPSCFCIKENQLLVWPYPSQSRNWAIIYYRRPATLVNNSDVADWDPLNLEVLQRAIDVQLAIRFGPVMHGDVDQCEKDYRSALNKAIANDKENANRPGMGRGVRRFDIGDMNLPAAT